MYRVPIVEHFCFHFYSQFCSHSAALWHSIDPEVVMVADQLYRSHFPESQGFVDAQSLTFEVLVTGLEAPILSSHDHNSHFPDQNSVSCHHL